METTNTLINYLKKDMTEEEKIKFFVRWLGDEDRVRVYDLDNDTNANTWINKYGAKCLYDARRVSRYWMENGKDDCVFEMPTDAITISEYHMNKYFGGIDGIVADIQRRYESYHNEKSVEEWFENYYESYIDIKKFKSDTRKDYDCYTWIGACNDGCYRIESNPIFSAKESCYYDMRDAVLEKMKWNTEWTDVDADDSSIGYKVHFNENFIVHESYSGIYSYIIVKCTIDGEIEDKEKADKELASLWKKYESRNKEI